MKIATITAVYNEEDLLPQHLGHYRNQGVDRIFILDSGSTDKTVEIAGRHHEVEVSSFEVPAVGFDGPKHHAIMKKMLECKGEFDFVILVDADEFVIPAEVGTIRSAIEATPWDRHDLYATTGYAMVQGPGEADYSPEVPITQQRKWGVFDRLYSKPCIVSPKAYPVFAMGIHSVSGIPRVKTFVGAFKLLHYPAPSEAIFLKRRLAKESKVHLPRAMKTEKHFKELYEEWKSNPEISAVI